MANTKKKIVDVLNLKRLQKSLLSGKKHFSGEEMKVPVDVKEGHFAVMAVDDDQLGRFIVPLSFLTRPSFLRLLEQAAEEYGFDHRGALTVPCRPTELQRILAEETPSNWTLQ
ncbi:auxin-induced protein X15-like [Salvia hispanica]|uniref:auxin-induced protein X15-like n=1 Tax=Salvia hispanica TaxID=49212 RepID=UPI002009C4A3|nr:auxin-induced protein X15-like [Salvia hispanica]